MTCRGGSKVKIREAGTGVQVAFFVCLFLRVGGTSCYDNDFRVGRHAPFVREWLPRLALFSDGATGLGNKNEQTGGKVRVSSSVFSSGARLNDLDTEMA